MSNKQLQNNEARYRSLFQYNIDAITIFDTEGIFIEINEATEKFLEYSKEEIIGTCFLDYIVPEMVEETREQFRKVLDGKPHQYETAMYRKSGEEILLHVTIIPIIFDGKIDGVHCIAKDITESRRNAENAHFMAYYDIRTGLGNQHLFEKDIDYMLDKRQTNEETIALLFIDLDRFKFVNDHFGHQTGNLLLQYVADRLKQVIGEKGSIYRHAGDEFLVLIDNPIDVECLVQRILEKLSEPYNLSGIESIVTVSIGVSISFKNNTNKQKILHSADQAMYHAKRWGGNDYHIHGDKTRERTRSHLEMETLLRKAIRQQEFIVHYQPIVDTDGKIQAVETLLRWNSPKLGMVPPLDFIPLAEETGLIAPIGDWVLREAIQQGKTWQEQGKRPIMITVNLSLRQFFHQNLLETVKGILKEVQFPAEYLVLEITETVSEQMETALQIMEEFRKMGIKVAMDDFGTGYSSLNHLRKLPIEHLKIDRSFLTDIQADETARNLLQSIIMMTQNLKLKVIAEGVENEYQSNFLKEQNCDFQQGYYYSRPVPAEEVEKLF